MIAILTLSLSVNAIPIAKFMDGQLLHKFSNEFEKHSRGEKYNSYEAGLFEGYVIGVADTYEGDNICIPSVKSGQIQAVVSKFLNENPKSWNSGASDVVTEALIKTWPCIK